MAQKTGTNWYAIVVWVTIAICIFLLIRNCNSTGNMFQCNKPDTVSYSKDTVIYKRQFDTTYVPVPYELKVTRWKTDTLETLDIVRIPIYIPVKLSREDSNAILRDFFSVRYYKDTVGTKANIVIIEDTISQNRIMGRYVSILDEDTTIKEKLVLDKNRTILYAGVSLSGNKQDWFSGVGWDLSLKTKNDMIFGAGVRFIKGGITYYEAQTKFPLRLKRKK